MSLSRNNLTPAASIRAGRVASAVLLLLPLLASGVLLPGCDDDDGHGYVCRGDTCYCDQGQSCAIPCDSGTCSAICEGDNKSCVAECANGECACGPDSRCDFTCLSAPCLIDCAPGSECNASCANGDCICALGGDCSFTCDSGPCHVTCEGGNESCSGECSNGTCTCGEGSNCSFTCISGPCHTVCESGSTCVVECVNGRAGTQDCDIVSCAQGTPLVCPDGRTTTCGAPCPTAS